MVPSRSSSSSTSSLRTRQQAEPTDGTKNRVIQATVDCILEQGFYRASTNEIARRAGVSWGVIQHYFGTREALMVAVLKESSRQFHELVAGASVAGETTLERVEQLLKILSSHYGSREYLAYLQIILNLDHNPDTSLEVRKTMSDLSQSTTKHIRRLLTETVGDRPQASDLATTLFLAIRGFGFSQQLIEAMAYDSPPSPSNRAARQRRILAQAFAQIIDGAT